MVRSENKTLREEKKGGEQRGGQRVPIYTRWPKSSPGLDFGHSLTRHGPDPASLDSTASKGASLYSTASKGAAATASKDAPATASKGAPATASKGAAPWRSVCVVVRTLGQLHGRAVTAPDSKTRLKARCAQVVVSRRVTTPGQMSVPRYLH